MCISHLYIVEPMAHEHVLNPDYDVDLPIEGYKYNWTCAVYLQPAKSGIAHEFQFIENTDSCIYFDFDQFWIPWLICVICDHRFHFHCITKGITPAEFNLIGPYKCPYH